jgi:hypothetical protein
MGITCVMYIHVTPLRTAGVPPAPPQTPPPRSIVAAPIYAQALRRRRFQEAHWISHPIGGQRKSMKVKAEKACQRQMLDTRIDRLSFLPHPWRLFLCREQRAAGRLVPPTLDRRATAPLMRDNGTCGEAA